MPTLVMLSGEDSIAAGARIASMLVSRVVELCRNPQPVVGNCQPLRFQRILLLSCTVFPTWVEWLPIVTKVRRYLTGWLQQQSTDALRSQRDLVVELPRQEHVPGCFGFQTWGMGR